METLIIQPPVVQLNSPYPSGAYLSSFFKNEGHNSFWIDLNVELFHKIFSSDGLKKIFSLSAEKALKLAENAESKGDEETSFNLRRYVSQKSLWIDWIDQIVLILQGKGFEQSHRFCFGAHVPRGSRMENYLSSLDSPLTTDNSRSLASFALADLADYITFTYDENFSLVRYAERLTISKNNFSQIEKNIFSPVMNDFYIPLLQEKIVPLIDSMLEKSGGKKILVCISVPFAGVFTPALCTGNFIKKNYGSKVYVSLGGGFINTELRQTNEKNLAFYCDSLCYDRGYATYKTLMEKLSVPQQKKEPIYNLRQFILPFEENSFTEKIVASASEIKIISPKSPDIQELAFEEKTTRTLIPDFSSIDFSKYPRLIDDTNPMHRLWSDGSWIKSYMAHGCYWHKCAFCDVTLDYVKGYCPVNIKALYKGLLEQCEKHGVYGIHFVDEAMPPAAMIEFAKENIAHGTPVTWWGNIRFEKYFSRDKADFLARGGLIGVSAGLESATGNGLSVIHKGTDLSSIVSACCAFKEAGILVHSYMIFGFWNQSEQDLIDSMETLRQMFQNSLLDSAFFHKFSLTKNSTVYREWKSGKIKGLQPIENPKNAISQNEISFKGEEKSYKYAESLNIALENWMHGEKIEKSVQSWFNFKMPSPSISKDFVLKLVEKYEKRRDEEYFQIFPESESFNKKKFVWLGGKILILKTEICWTFMGEMFYFPRPENSQKIAEFLDSIKPEKSSAQFSEVYNILGKKLFLKLRPSGLCCIDF